MSTTSIALSGSCITGQSALEEVDPLYRLPTFTERLVAAVIGCSHRGKDFGWAWPQRSRVDDGLVFPAGFDSVQTCSACGQQRFFKEKTLTPGPLFFRTDVAQTRTS